MLWATFKMTFLKEKASKLDTAGHSAFGQSGRSNTEVGECWQWRTLRFVKGVQHGKA